MPHGYLNYDVPGGMKYAATCVDDAVAFMKEILEIWNIFILILKSFYLFAFLIIFFNNRIKIKIYIFEIIFIS